MDLDKRLQRQLICAEEAFYDALIQGESSLEKFHSDWTSLSSTVTSSTPFLSPETLEVAHSVSRTIALVATHYMELDATAEKLSQQLAQDTQSILDDDSVSPSPAYSSQFNTHDSIPPPYTKVTYDWLVSNLHNPYPTKKVKQAISTQCQCPEKDIDAWFVDVRRRIGWNKIRKILNNKRDATVAAASQFFGKTNTSMPLDPATIMAFSKMKKIAQSLYSKHVETPLVRELHGSEPPISGEGDVTDSCTTPLPPDTPPELTNLIPSPVASSSDSDECSTPVLPVASELVLGVRARSPINVSSLSSRQLHNDYGSPQRKRKRRLSEAGEMNNKRSRTMPDDRQYVAVSDPAPIHSSSTFPELPYLGDWFSSGLGSYSSVEISDTLDIQLFDYASLQEQIYVTGYEHAPIGTGDSSRDSIDPLDDFDLLCHLPFNNAGLSAFDEGLVNASDAYSLNLFDQDTLSFPAVYQPPLPLNETTNNLRLESYTDQLQALNTTFGNPDPLPTNALLSPIARQ
uniref:HD1 protein n=1 Tax=Volvariella volvacea TaxID=36659 RepID=A0A1B2U727_9AGAR|nr:HD1 protein [Volvariella volvacea]